jgi:PEP-CTERM motif
MTRSIGNKARLLGSALAMGAALFAGPSQAAAYQASFGGLTFTFIQTDADTLTFEIKGTPSNADNAGWSGVQFLGAFDLKDLGLDFTTATGTANGPGATNLLGMNAQLSANSKDCSSTSSPPPSICFDINPDFNLGTTRPIDLLYTIDFSSALTISSVGPHLQIVFTNTAGGDKVGSLYSENVGLCLNCGGTPPEQIAEPGSLALLGLGLGFAGYIVRRRRKL